jgi:hypothetical protein
MLGAKQRIDRQEHLSNNADLQVKENKSENLYTSPPDNQAIVPQTKFAWNDLYSLRFTVQVFFSMVVLIFCISQLVSGGKGGDGKNDAIYWGGVTGILALWMPSPSSSGSTPVNQANIGTVGPVIAGNSKRQ